MNTQKIVDNILGKKKNKLKQYNVSFDNINTIEELEALLMLINIDISGRQPFPNFSLLIFSDGKIVQIQYKEQHILKEPISDKSFMELSYALKDLTYVIISKEFNVDEIYKIMKKLYIKKKRGV